MIHLIFLIFFNSKVFSSEVVRVVTLDSIRNMAKDCFKDFRPIKRYIVKTDEFQVEEKLKKKFREEKYFKVLNNGEEKIIARKVISIESQEIKEIEVCSKYWTK